MLLGIVVSKTVYMPIWTYFVALGFGAAAMLPMSFVYALSGFSVKVGFFNELIYGCESFHTMCDHPILTDNFILPDMIDAKGSSRHPLGQLAYRIISGNVWYDARIVLEDQKVRLPFHDTSPQCHKLNGIRSDTTFICLPARSSESKFWPTYSPYPSTTASCGG